MPTHAYRLRLFVCSLPAWVVATCVSACVGTPTPEPPDTLPRPDETKIFGAMIEIDIVSTPATNISIPITGKANAVEPNSELWIVNLDSTDPPRTTRAAGNGAFGTEISGEPGDRIRLVVRTDSRHSLPLDATVIKTGASTYGVGQLPATALPCLSVEPANELTSVVGQGRELTRQFTLTSSCREPVDVDSATLRFGDAGFDLSAPTRVLPGQSALLEVRISGHDDAREHADIVLLEVSSGGQSGRYALGLWSVATSSVGND
jgi:hypothetical protein